MQQRLCNECLDKSKNDCSDHAVCEDASEGYTCHCEPGFVDASPNIARYPGRICNKPKGPDFYGPPSTLPQVELRTMRAPCSMKVVFWFSAVAMRPEKSKVRSE
jgi:hypothetical protein